MAKNIKRTLQGKSLDFEELTLRNEKVRAVGNMNVNAAGDEIDNSNKTVATGTRRASKHYRRQISKRVKDTPVMNSIKAARELAMQYIENESDVIPGIDDIADVDPDVFAKTQKDEVSEELIQEVISKSTSGLAGAIAKAKEVKQEPLKTPREEERDGVKKI